MMKRLLIIALTPICMLLFVSAVPAQKSWTDKKCSQPIYEENEVTRPARIVAGPDLSGVSEVFRNASGRVKLEAVLCRSGSVTDIRVVEDSSPATSDFVGAALSLMRFVPAELNFHSVSQKTQFEYEIKSGEAKRIPHQPAVGRLVESVDVMGNRRFSAGDILSLVKTRPGETYDRIQVGQDLKSILSTGNFDPLNSRVLLEDGVRGGVHLLFEVMELPLIGDITFEGLKIDPAIVKEAWEVADVKMETGAPYSPVTGKRAIQIIKQLLDYRAVGYAKVEIQGKFITSQKLNLIFVITDR